MEMVKSIAHWRRRGSLKVVGRAVSQEESHRALHEVNRMPLFEKTVRSSEYNISCRGIFMFTVQGKGALRVIHRSSKSENYASS